MNFPINLQAYFLIITDIPSTFLVNFQNIPISLFYLTVI